MKRRQNKERKMKTRILLTTLSVAALTAITINANADLLSPRALGNQIKHVSGIANDPDLVAVDQGLALPPRAAGNGIATTAGTNGSVNSTATCAQNMAGSPKTIQACVEHPATMPGCVKTVAAAN
jgi:hypothetical protein